MTRQVAWLYQRVQVPAFIDRVVRKNSRAVPEGADWPLQQLREVIGFGGVSSLIDDRGRIFTKRLGLVAHRCVSLVTAGIVAR